MPIDDRTTNRSYQLPNVGNQLVEDVARLRAALQAIDADVFARYTKTEVDTLINDLIAGAPGALNTLDELAAALGDDANYAATVTTALANRYTKTESDSRYLSSTDGSVTTNKLAPGIAPIVTSLNGGPLAGTRNRIINGDMRVDQRNSGASVTAVTDSSIFPVDRWPAECSVSSKFTAQRSTVAPAGFTNSLLATSSSAYSVAAGDFFLFRQNIEGFNTADLGWGSAGALSATLSFWVRSSLTGSFSGSLRNASDTRSYVFSYTVNATNTWEYKTITIPGDTSGTWLTDNSKGIALQINLGAGSTYSTTAGAWSAGNYVAATGSTSVVGTSGATFYITGVQLETGSVATPFERRSYGQELSLCQRYYQTGNFKIWGYNTASNPVGGTVSFNTSMRSNPTVTTPGAFGSNAGTIVIEATYLNGFILYAPAIVTEAVAFQGPFTASIEL